MNIRPHLWVRIILYIGFFIIAFAAWYNWKFSMDYVPDQEYGNKSSYVPSLLIATQGSAFKDSIAQSLINIYKDQDIYIKVIDATKLNAIREEDWDAIFINHTWEISRPPKQVSAFLENMNGKNKLVVYGTSGDGRLAIKGVDAISGSSMMNEIETRTKEVKNRLDEILDLKI